MPTILPGAITSQVLPGRDFQVHQHANGLHELYLAGNPRKSPSHVHSHGVVSNVCFQRKPAALPLRAQAVSESTSTITNQARPQAQSASVSTFEDLGLAPNSFDNDAGPSGQFVSGGNSFTNRFSTDPGVGGIWSGWAISSTTDTTTPGFTNQYSAITGSGADGSPTYAVAFTFDADADPLHPADSFVDLAGGTNPTSIQVTNTTYAYLSMLNGDSFEEAFGPGDYFLLTIAGYSGPEGTGTKVGEVDYYLANFLGSNHYIINSWQTLDLTSLAGAQSLQFGLESSMNDPIFGMNTPAYVAVDNLTASTKAVTGGSVRGVVFNDLNDDGVQDNGEGGLQNWVVQLLSGSTLVATANPTDINGNYTISGVAPGTYTLREVLQSGYTQTAPSPIPPGTSSVTIADGGSITGKNFGNMLPVLTGVSVTPVNPSIAKGLTVQFDAMGSYSDHINRDITSLVTWSSTNNTVATINTSGKASTLATGASNISASLNGLSGSTTLTVNTASLVSIAVTPGSPSIAKGSTQQFTATGTYSDNSTQNLTAQVNWTSATPSFATIAASGLASGVATGTSTISATFTGVTGSTVLNVSPATLSSIAVTPANPSIAKGLTQQFTATGTYSDNSTQNLTSQVTWASATPFVATIAASGLASGVATGTSTISATLDGVTGSTVLTVSAATLSSIAVTPANPSIAKGLTQQFTATGTYTDNTTQNLTSQVTWVSATPLLASIAASGLASGVATGTSTISATLDGVTGSTVLTVSAATLSAIAVTPANPSIAKGLTQQFTATGTYSDNSIQNLTSQVTWASATPLVATIAASGLASGAATGTSTISATLNGVTGSTVLNVSPATLSSIAVTPANPSVAKGLTQQFTATATYSDNTTQDLTSQVNWLSTTPAVATISAAGLTAGVTMGTSTISATLNSVTGSTVLTVNAATLSSIAVLPFNPSITSGQTEKFSATGTYSDGSTVDLTSQVTWESTNTGVATINAAGLASSFAAGTTGISAKLGSVKSPTSVLTVTTPASAAITAVSVSWGTATTVALQLSSDGARLLPAGRTNDLPWTNINRLNITLSSPATLSASDVSVSGITVNNYGPVTISGSGTNYTISLAAPIAVADRVTFTIGNAGITRFTGRLDVLPGDVNDDGIVTIQDAAQIHNILLGFGPVTVAIVFLDINGDGVVDLDDYNQTRAVIGTQLP